MPYSLREFWSEKKKSSIQILGKVQTSYRRESYAWYQSQSVVKSTFIDRSNLIISVKILQVCDSHPYDGWHACSLSGLLPYWKATQNDIRTLIRGPCCRGEPQST